MPNIIRFRNNGTVEYNNFNNAFKELSADENDFVSDDFVNVANEQIASTEIGLGIYNSDQLAENSLSDLDFSDNYDFPADTMNVQTEQIPQQPLPPKEPEFDREEFMAKIKEQAEKMSSEILDKAMVEANEKAQQLGEQAKAEGYELGNKQGYNDGFSKGYIEAYEKGLKAVNQDCDRLLCEIQAGIEMLMQRKKELEEEHLDEMKELCLAVSEKIVGMNLESQGEVIKQMILNSLDSSKKTQWLKIYISGFDSDRYFQIEDELLEAVRHISEFVKVEIIDEAESGTCIIEMPEKIIDASVGTQMENIKNILDN